MKIIRIYSDESRHKNERFLLLGGLWVCENKIKLAKKAIANLRQKNGYINNKGKHIDFLGEFKWTKVSKKYLKVYKKLTDLFFEFIEKDILRACIMLIDTHDPAVLAYNNIKKEGYFLLLYQLYLHNSKIPAIYKIFPDRITNPTQSNINFNALKTNLNNAFCNKFKLLLNPKEYPKDESFVNNLTPINSKKCDFIQMIDVVMGALGYFQNRHFENPGASRPKTKLMKYVIDKLIYSGTIKIQGKKFLVAKSTKFNIWLFKPNKKGV